MQLSYTFKEVLIVQGFKNQTFRRNGLFAVNIVIPLIFGLLIYLTKAERTYLSDFLSAYRSALPIIDYPEIIRNYACDFLWAYSLFFCLRLSMGEKLKGKHNLMAVVVTSITAVGLETIQLIQTIPGVYDPWDIAVELTAIVIANLISTIIERRFNNYEKA